MRRSYVAEAVARFAPVEELKRSCARALLPREGVRAPACGPARAVARTRRQRGCCCVPDGWTGMIGRDAQDGGHRSCDSYGAARWCRAICRAGGGRRFDSDGSERVRAAAEHCGSWLQWWPGTGVGCSAWRDPGCCECPAVRRFNVSRGLVWRIPDQDVGCSVLGHGGVHPESRVREGWRSDTRPDTAGAQGSAARRGARRAADLGYLARPPRAPSRSSSSAARSRSRPSSRRPDDRMVALRSSNGSMPDGAILAAVVGFQAAHAVQTSLSQSPRSDEAGSPPGA